VSLESGETRILTVSFCDSLDQINGSWDTADWLAGCRDWRRLGHTCCLAQSIIDLCGVNSKRSSYSTFHLLSALQGTSVEFRAVSRWTFTVISLVPSSEFICFKEHAENPRSVCGAHIRKCPAPARSVVWRISSFPSGRGSYAQLIQSNGRNAKTLTGSHFG